MAALASSPHAYNDTCTSDWCVAGATATRSGHFWSLSTSRQRAGANPGRTSLLFFSPSINAGGELSVSPRRLFVRLLGPARRAHFLLHSVWRPSSEGGGGDRQGGGNRGEGETSDGGKEIETVPEKQEKKGIFLKLWASLNKNHNMDFSFLDF